MTRSRPLAAALVAVALALGGCVTLLPRSKPAQLYRFGVPASEPPDAGASGAAPLADGRIGVMLARVDMQRAAGGDQLLTVTGDQAAFIDGARWLSPAPVLLEAAVEDGFAARSRSVRLLGRAEFAAAQATLRLDVPVFETRYPAPGAAPVVRVGLRALLTRRAGGFAAGRDISAEAPAADNRVSAIVVAYDTAVDKAVAELVAWTDANAALAAAPAPPLSGASPSPEPPRRSAARRP